jgi:hypothetical protein
MQQSNWARRVALRRVLRPEEGGMGKMMNVLRMRSARRVISIVHGHGWAWALVLGLVESMLGDEVAVGRGLV